MKNCWACAKKVINVTSLTISKWLKKYYRTTLKQKMLLRFFLFSKYYALLKMITFLIDLNKKKYRIWFLLKSYIIGA